MPVNDYRSGGSLDRCEVIKVKGEGGAKSIKIPPNSSCLFMSDALSDAWTRAKSTQSRYKGG